MNLEPPPSSSSSPRPTRSSMRQALRSSRMSATVVLDPTPIVENSDVHCAAPTAASDKSELMSSPPSKATDGDLSCLMCSTVFQSAAEFEYHIEVHASLCPSLCLRCCRSFNDRRLLYRHLHFKHGIPSRHFKEMDDEVQATSLSSQTETSSAIVNNGDEDNGSRGNDEDGISRMKQGFLPETSDSWKMSVNRSTDSKMTSVEVNDAMCSSKGDVATSAAAPTPTNTAATTTRKPLKRCQICDKVFQKITDLRHHLTASHSDVEPIECIPCNRFFATPRSFSIHQRMVHGFLDRTNRKRGGGGGSRKVDFNDGGGSGVAGIPTSDGEENTDGDDDNCKKQRADAGNGGDVEGRVTVVGPLENIVSEPDLELLNEVAPPKHFQGVGVSASSSSSSKNAWDDGGCGGGGGELSSNEDLVFCVATKKDETDRVTRSEAIKFRVSLQTEEVLVTRVLGTNVANGERCFLYKCHWCSEIVVSLDALLEHIAAHARNQQKTVMCYNCGQLFCGGERGVEELKDHLRVYHGNGGGIAAAAAAAERSQQHQHELVNHESRHGMISQCDDDDDDDDCDGGDCATAQSEVTEEEEGGAGGGGGGNGIMHASMDINEVHREESVQLDTSSKSQLDDSKIGDIGLGLINGSLDAVAAAAAAASLNVKLEPPNEDGDDDDDDDGDEVHVKLEPPDEVKHDLARGVREECSSPREYDPDCAAEPPAGVFFPELSVKAENHVVDDGGGGRDRLLEDGADEDDEDGDDEDGEDDEAEEDLSTAKEAASTLSPSSEVVAPSVVISEDGTRGYQCNVCQKLFERLFSLNRHLRGHTGFKPCYCRECGKGFSEPRNLRHHVIRFHSDGSLRHLLRRRRYGGGEGGKKRRTATSTTTTTAVSDRSPPDGLLLDDDYSSPDATIYSELSADGAEFGCQSSTGSEIPEIPLTATQQGQGQGQPPPPPLQSNPWDDDDHHHQHHHHHRHHHHHHHQQQEQVHHHHNHQQLSSKAAAADDDDDSIVESDSKCLPPHSHHQLVRHLLNQAPQTNAGDALCGADMNSAPLEEDENDAASMAAVDLSLLPARSRTFDDSMIGNMHASSSDLPSMSVTNYMTEQEFTDEQLGQSDFQLGGSADSAKSRKTKRKSGVYLSRYLPRLDIVVSPVMRSKSSTKVLPNGKTVFTCLYCRKVFATSSDLNRHMDFHEDLRPYKCEFCDYCSRTNSQLKVHMMRHQGIKQYPCEPCKYFAVTSSDLNRHKKSQGHLLRASKFDVSKADKSGTGGDLEESSCSMDSGDRRSAVGRMKRGDGDEENDDDNDGGEGEDSDLDLQDDNAELDAAFNDICDGDDVLMAP